MSHRRVSAGLKPFAQVCLDRRAGREHLHIIRISR